MCFLERLNGVVSSTKTFLIPGSDKTNYIHLKLRAHIYHLNPCVICSAPDGASDAASEIVSSSNPDITIQEPSENGDVSDDDSEENLSSLEVRLHVLNEEETHVTQKYVCKKSFKKEDKPQVLVSSFVFLKHASLVFLKHAAQWLLFASFSADLDNGNFILRSFIQNGMHLAFFFNWMCCISVILRFSVEQKPHNDVFWEPVLGADTQTGRQPDHRQRERGGGNPPKECQGHQGHQVRLCQWIQFTKIRWRISRNLRAIPHMYFLTRVPVWSRWSLAHLADSTRRRPLCVLPSTDSQAKQMIPHLCPGMRQECSVLSCSPRLVYEHDQ